MLAYNEKSGVSVEVAFFDANERPTLPSTVHWRLDCATSNQVLQDDVAIEVESDEGPDGIVRYLVQIDVPGSLNAIQSNKNARELKKLLVIANKDRNNEFSQEYSYYVTNLRGRS